MSTAPGDAAEPLFYCTWRAWEARQFGRAIRGLPPEPPPAWYVPKERR